MKFRPDFVTNSSSSSFIFAFKDEADYKEFIEACKDQGFKNVKNLVKNHRDDKNINKEETINFLRNCMTREFEDATGIRENNPAYEEELEKYLNKYDFYRKKKTINKSDIIVTGQIWDNYDDDLYFAYAVRNGLLDVFPWCLLSYNIG